MIHEILYRNTELIDRDLLFYNCLSLTCWTEVSILYCEEQHFKNTEKWEICFFFTNTNKILSVPQIILLTICMQIWLEMIPQYIASSSGGNHVYVFVSNKTALVLNSFFKTDQLIRSNCPFPVKANSSGLVFTFF